jgi:hypothetical protein
MGFLIFRANQGSVRCNAVMEQTELRYHCLGSESKDGRDLGRGSVFGLLSLADLPPRKR